MSHHLNIDHNGLEGKFSTSGEQRCAVCGFDHSEDAYEIRQNEPLGPRSIYCRRCGMESYNAGDVDERYCANCKIFHEDFATPLLLWNGDYRELMLCLCWPCAQKRMRVTETSTKA